MREYTSHRTVSWQQKANFNSKQRDFSVKPKTFLSEYVRKLTSVLRSISIVYLLSIAFVSKCHDVNPNFADYETTHLVRMLTNLYTAQWATEIVNTVCTSLVFWCVHQTALSTGGVSKSRHIGRVGEFYVAQENIVNRFDDCVVNNPTCNNWGSCVFCAWSMPRVYRRQPWPFAVSRKSRSKALQ
jgi:hypothetical protein